MSVFEERGVFWWHNEAIAEGLLAPDTHVAGLLHVEDNGRAVLELDGYLSNPHGPMAPMAREPVTRCIQGLLKGSGERVLLCDLNRNGGRFSTNGMSYEKFSAAHCPIVPFAQFLGSLFVMVWKERASQHCRSDA
jgi:hypothetical protein